MFGYPAIKDDEALDFHKMVHQEKDSSSEVNIIQFPVKSTAITEETDGVRAKLTRFEMLSEVDERMKESFIGFNHLKSRNPILSLSDDELKAILERIFDGDPWLSLDKAVYDIPVGRRVHLYKLFNNEGALERLKKCYKEVFDSKLQDFRCVCLLANKPLALSKYGGRELLEQWWPRFMELSFEQNGYKPLDEINFTYQGINVCPFGTAHHFPLEILVRVRSEYDKAFKRYMDESFENALLYMFKSNVLYWEDVPQKWQKKFCAMAIGVTPFVDPENIDVKLDQVKEFFRSKPEYLKRLMSQDSPPAQKKDLPVSYYRDRRERNVFTEMYREATSEYLDSLDKVMDFICSNTFRNLGGWAVIPEKWQRILIFHAVRQSSIEDPGLKSLQYRHGEKLAKVGNLTVYLKRAGKIDFLKKCYEESLAFKKRTSPTNSATATTYHSVRSAGSKSPSRDDRNKIPVVDIRTEKDMFLEPVSDEEIRKLIKIVQETRDEQAALTIIARNARIINLIAKKLSMGNSRVREIFEWEARSIVYQAIFDFDLNRVGENGKKMQFIGFINMVLNQGLRALSGMELYGREVSKTKNIANQSSRLRKYTGDPNASFHSASPEAIAEAFGIDIKKATEDKILYTQRPISLASMVYHDGEKTLGEVTEDKKAIDPQRESIRGERLEVLNKLLNTLSRKNKFIIIHSNGIGKEANYSSNDLAQIFGVSIEEMEEWICDAVRNLFSAIRGFKDKQVDGVSPYIDMLLTMFDQNFGDIRDIIYGRNELGKMLLNGVSDEAEVLYAIIENMDVKEKVLLTSVFNLKPHKIVLNGLGKALGVSGARIAYVGRKSQEVLGERGKGYSEIFSE